MIRYKKGDTIGNNGISFIKEIDKVIGKKRKCLFKCHCGRNWESSHTMVNTGKIKSCGCSIKSKYVFSSKEKAKEAQKNKMYLKECINCNNLLPISKFSLQRSTPTGYSTRYYLVKRCSKCENKRKVIKYKDSLGKYAETQKNYQAKTLSGRASLIRNRAKQRSKISDLDFNLTTKEITLLLTPLKCKVTNIPLELKKLSFNPYAPSLDRIDSNKGYITGNVQVVCMIYNFCKNKFTSEQTLQFFKDIKANERF